MADAAAGPVGGAHEGNVVRQLDGGIEDHERDASGAQLVALLLRQLGHGHDAGRAAGEGVVDPVADRVALRAELGQHDAHAVFAGHPLHAADDLDAPHVLQLVEDELHHVAAVGGAGLR